MGRKSSRSRGFIGGQPPTFETVATAPDDTAVILYTSGTTGQPKGAELTHLNMVVNGMVLGRAVRGSHDGSGRHATAITLPLFHATAQTAQMLAYLHLGGTLVLLPRFDPAALLAAMTAERITHWIGVPTMYWTLLKHAREQNIDVSTRRGDAAACGIGRRADAGRADARLREDVRRPHHRRLWTVGDRRRSRRFNHLDRPSKPGTVGQPLFAVDIMSRR